MKMMTMMLTTTRSAGFLLPPWEAGRLGRRPGCCPTPVGWDWDDDGTDDEDAADDDLEDEDSEEDDDDDEDRDFNDCDEADAPDEEGEEDGEEEGEGESMKERRQQWWRE